LDYVKMLELAEGVARLHAEYPSVFAQYEHGDVLNMIRLAYIQGYAAGVTGCNANMPKPK
jgi:hypothetical protein